MKAIIRRLSRLENRLSPLIVTPLGWDPKAELLKQIEDMATRIPHHEQTPEEEKAVYEQVEDWLRRYRSDDGAAESLGQR